MIFLFLISKNRTVFNFFIKNDGKKMINSLKIEQKFKFLFKNSLLKRKNKSISAFFNVFYGD